MTEFCDWYRHVGHSGKVMKLDSVAMVTWNPRNVITWFWGLCVVWYMSDCKSLCLFFFARLFNSPHIKQF